MKAVVVAAVAVAEIAEVSEVSEAAETAAGAGTVEREHPNYDWVSKGRIAAVVAGRAGNCKQGCTARTQPAIAEDLHLLGSEEVLETAGVPNLEAAAWVDTVESRMHSFLYIWEVYK